MILFVISGCVTRRACDRKFPGSVDSVRTVSRTVTTYKDTVVYVKLIGDTVFSTLLLTDKPVDSKLNTPLAKCTVSVKDGKLTHRLEQKDTTLSSTIRNAQKYTTTSNIKEHTKTRIIKENIPTPWQWFQIYLGRGFILFFVLGFLFLVFRKRWL